MGYLEKSTVMKALNEDMETTLACYDGKGEKDIIKFCYECIRIELDKLPQYVPENAIEQPKISDVDKIVDQLEEEKEYANANFEEYVQEVEPCLDAEYDDTFSQGVERAIKILKQEKETVEKHNRTTRGNDVQKRL